MQARFLLGPAGSGKTFRCLAEIRAALRAAPDGPPLILLAPKQATFQLERQLLADPALHGYTRLQILSFERLAKFVLDALRVAPPQRLSEEGRIMVLRALLLEQQPHLRRFRASARATGLAAELSVLLGELQQHQFNSKKLTALAQRQEIPAQLRDKLHDLALLLDAYTDWLARHDLHDADSLLGVAAEALREKSADGSQKPETGSRRRAEADAFGNRSSIRPPPPAGGYIAELWLDGFAEMTPAELELLAAILPHCGRATLAFCLEAEPQPETSWLSTWSVTGRALRDCRARITALPDAEPVVEILPRDATQSRFANAPALAALEANWSKPAITADHASQIQLAVGAEPDAEATLAARNILTFVRNGGRFRETAVLVRDLATHHKAIERSFHRYGIPFFLDRRESVTHHPLAELTRSALRTVAFDWRHEDWFAALKSGFAPGAEPEIDSLENEALARGWRGAKWRQPLMLGPDPAPAAERLRQKLLPPFTQLADALATRGQPPTGTQLAEAVRQFWRSLEVERTLEQWSSDHAVADAPGDWQAALHRTVWEQMNAWLDNVALAFPTEALPLRAWLQVLEAGLTNLSVGAIPPALDQVLVGAIDRSRNPELKLACVLGFNEALFPAAPAPPTLLTEADRAALSDCGGALGPDLFGRLARERYLGYIACTRASGRLLLTYARHSADGQTLNPSPFVAHLKRIFPGLTEETVTVNENWREVTHVSELTTPLVEIHNAKGDFKTRQAGGFSPSPPTDGGAGRGEEETRQIVAIGSHNWEQLLQLPALAEMSGRLRELHNPDPAERLSPPLADALYGPALRTSVSRMEQFAACPFRFFVHSGLRAEERKLFELDPREQGSFQHEVLKLFHEQLHAEKKRWRALLPAEARARVAAIAQILVTDYRDGLLNDTEQSRFTARTLTAALQDFVATLVTWMREQYDFEPAAVELGFGGKAPGDFPGWELALDARHQLVLQGRIDRVDLWREPGADTALCVVMDYKSSQKKLDPLLMRHGVQLQLPAYLNVLRHWREPQTTFAVARLIPAGVFYVSLRGQFERCATRTDAFADAATAQRLAYRHTGRFDAGVIGKLDHRLNVNAGDQFNYRRNKNGTLRANQTEALERMQFEQLLDNVETQLIAMGRRIFAGDAAVDPYRKGHATPCDFCDYRAICRIDPWTHSYRVLRHEEESAA